MQMGLFKTTTFLQRLNLKSPRRLGKNGAFLVICFSKEPSEVRFTLLSWGYFVYFMLIVTTILLASFVVFIFAYRYNQSNFDWKYFQGNSFENKIRKY